MKTVLNIILLIISISAIILVISKDTEISSKLNHFIIALACISAIFTKKYRYILCAVALILIAISFYFQ